MGKIQTKQCISCNAGYITWEKYSMCLNCRIMREEIPDHIPEEQTIKFIEIWKDKNSDSVL